MADSCTYADLRFVKATPPLKECGTPGPDPEAFSTVYMNAGEHMYANVKNNEEVSQDRARSKYIGREPGKPQGGISFSKCITLILAVSFLITLVTCIGLGVQIFQVSKDRETLETHFLQKIQMQNKSLEDSEKRSKETELKLEEAKDKLEDIQVKNDFFNSSLHLTQNEMEENKQELSKCLKGETEIQDRLRKAEGTLNGIKELFKGHEEAAYCQRGWNLLAGSCLYFSVTAKSMEESEQECKSTGAWLIGYKIKDSAVKKFMNNRQSNVYWVGLRTKGQWDGNWMDPRHSKLSSVKTAFSFPDTTFSTKSTSGLSNVVLMYLLLAVGVPLLLSLLAVLLPIIVQLKRKSVNKRCIMWEPAHR